MAKLILSMDGLVLKEIPLNQERLSIGRKPHNDIQIDNLAISGEHAVVVTILADSFLEDLNSTNGTLVNGQPIKKHFLRNNDVIELGKYKLKYMADLQAGAAASEFERNVATRSGQLKMPSELQLEPVDNLTRSSVGTTSQPKAPAPSHTAAIQLLNGPNAGKELDLTKTLTTLGKPGLQVAVIAKRPHGYFITHVEGSQFPVVNGKSLDAQAYPLGDHDVIEIAGIKMAFFLKG
ncbi:FHA domain-containing protein [Ferribacterium limneticum]|uniref:FHA domain-containing protein n=1 Tax=Ferribacterium limneticum TaxID=76259 RepID=UPI001CFBD39E|nr:FHA domain-containing protein [Ferribacterium limneticum]UCV29282.1 FHA domain-containing protein [Ferribacterium limneticum]UCV33201.1 FHA domain-containing protein [Ferribacterium limneticum]